MTRADRDDSGAKAVIVLRALNGEDTSALASEIGVTPEQVVAWRETFLAGGRAAVSGDSDGKRFVTRHVSREDALADVILPEYFVWWDDVTAEQVTVFENVLDLARREEDVQTFLAAYPTVLVQPLGGGHGRWVIPKKRLGAEHVTDFVMGERDSTGYSWLAVELESPRAKLFTTKGDESAALRHAMRQIEDWRYWLGQNQAYASRPSSDAGLGLADITAACPGLIIIGRRPVPSKANGRRREWRDRYNIEVHTYDWLAEKAYGRVAALDSFKARTTRR